jgi:protein gp37
MRQAPHHTYQSLTKAAGRLRKFIDLFPPNLWVGVSSAPDFFRGNRLSSKQQEGYTRAALRVLREVRQATGNIVWMSLEPVSWDMAHLFVDHPLDWVVIGAASNGRTYYQPDPEHIAGLLDVFDATNTPVFFKGNIKLLIKQEPYLGRFREDFPPYYHNGAAIPAVWRRQEMAVEHGWPLNEFMPETAVVSQPMLV